MRHLTNSLLAATSILTLTFAANAATYQSGTYQLDSAHSKIGFEVPHLVVSTVEGKFNNAEGTLILDDKFEKSKVKASAEIASVDTGNEKRDTHLKSPDFFDATKYPKMTFESTSVSGTPDAFKLTGHLTIKNVTKKVTFDGKLIGVLPNDGFGNQKAVFTAKSKVSRKEFGLTWNNMFEAGPVVGDEVTIDLRFETARPIPKK